MHDSNRPFPGSGILTFWLERKFKKTWFQAFSYILIPHITNMVTTEDSLGIKKVNEVFKAGLSALLLKFLFSLFIPCKLKLKLIRYS